jgi:hypothetical protein
MKKTYGEFISTLEPNQVFVFGSNLDGFHGGGAAGFASFGKHGNIWRDEDYSSKPRGWKGKWNVKGAGNGYQEGTEGRSYALPTVVRAGWKRSLTLDQIIDNIKTMYEFAKQHPVWEFLVAGSEQGNAPLNGYTHEDMARAYVQAGTGHIPENVVFSTSYQKLIELGDQ